MIMERITNINDLKSGQKLISFNRGKVNYYEFLMIHPHNPEYILCLNSTQDGVKIYSKIVYENFFTNYSEEEIFEKLREYYLKESEWCSQQMLNNKNRLE